MPAQHGPCSGRPGRGSSRERRVCKSARSRRRSALVRGAVAWLRAAWLRPASSLCFVQLPLPGRTRRTTAQGSRRSLLRRLLGEAHRRRRDEHESNRSDGDTAQHNDPPLVSTVVPIVRYTENPAQSAACRELFPDCGDRHAFVELRMIERPVVGIARVMQRDQIEVLVEARQPDDPASVLVR